MKIKEKRKAPLFKLSGTKNTNFELRNVKGKIIIYFYPKDDTPGCTLETKDFNSLISKFSKNNCNVYGISKDSLESHKKFKKKYKIKFDLLSDEKKIAIKAYKVWGKKQFMGKEFMGLIRSSFLIKNKKIIKEWRSVRVKNHAQEVLNYILNK